MSRVEAARIAAILPLPKKRGAIAPKGFTRRYGSSIAARIGIVARDGLDACVYKGTTAPADKAPPPSKKPTKLPGEEYETAAPPPPSEDVDSAPIEAPAEANTALPEAPVSAEPPVAQEPAPVTNEAAANQN